MKKLLYFTVGRSTFVLKDIEILKSEYEVIIFDFKIKSKVLVPFEFIRQVLFILFKGSKAKILLTQFGGYHSFIPVLFSKFSKKKSVIVLGGNDTVSFPSIQYGSFNNSLMRPFLKYSLRKANLLLPVSETLIEVDYTYQENDFPKQGYTYFVPGIKTPVKTIYNGFDPDSWFIGDKEPNSFVTVAADLRTRFGPVLKGMDLILGIAALFPDCKFYIVGGEFLNEKAPKNVMKLPLVSSQELRQILSTKQFYLQLSMSEGFPNGLCEGMISGCVPICSNVGAMPLIMKDFGYVLQKKSLNQLKGLITKAKEEYSSDKSVLTRKRILTEFSLNRRKAEFLEALSEIQD